ncbi:hypothetical protein [Robertmurraya massiliosenegalensis]|uniref:hypothetical protein n=1 Tax=Robertmurraya massiliosenegalensis TaxID=1287657 RepID=UPI0002DDF040|nr:hypothetical protein [Robertmurraya massiliosenegalensis]
MKKLVTKTLLAVSLLGVGFAFVNFSDYAGIPSQHSPLNSVYKYDEVAGIPSQHSIELMGIPSQH